MQAPDPAMPRGRAGELLHQYLTAIPDFARLEQLLHPDVSFTLFIPQGRTNSGRDRILAGLRREFGSFYQPDTFRLEVLDAFGERDDAAARFRITAQTSRGPYSNNYAIIARFADGLLVEAWEYLDSAGAREQLRPKTEE